jgi:hypothetical protein
VEVPVSRENPFLNNEERSLFSQTGRFQPRYVVKKPLDQADSDTNPEEMCSLVANAVEAIIRKGIRSFRCQCVSVRTDDGMSWSAEAVRQRIISQCPEFAVVGLGKNDDPDLPRVTQLIGERRLLHAAVKHKLAKWYPTLHISQISLLVACLGGVGVLVTIGNALLKILTPTAVASTDQFRTPVFLWLTAAVTLLGTISKYLADRLAPGQKESSIKQLKERLKEYEKQAVDHQVPERYTNFIEEVAREMQWIEKPRVVIIDNYEQLDPTSRAVMEQYFRVQRKNSSGSELWLILELPDGQGISQVIDVERERYELDKFDFLKQLPLSPKAIQELAQTLELREIPPGSTVKWICHGGLRKGERIIKFLEEHRKDHPINAEQYGDLEFYYLLSGASIPAEITFERRDLLSGLIQGKQRSQILKLLLRNTKLGTERAHSEFDRRLTNVQRQFTQFLECTASGGFTFLHEPAKILEEKAESFGLEDPGLVHLYWALYWYDGCQNLVPRAFLLRKLRRHLLKANVEKVPSPQLEPIVNQVFEALLYTIDSCLKTCLFDELPELVDKAVLFHGIRESHPQGRSQDRLLRSCWDVFSVLGDEKILATIHQLEGVRAAPASGAVEKRDSQPLTDLFLGAVLLDETSRDALRLAFQNWVGPTQENGEAARRNAEAFAGWLITSMAPLIPRTCAEGTLLEQALEGRGVLPGCFRETYARIVRQKSSVPMLTDIMTLSLCLWATALQLEDESNAEQFVLLVEMAHEALIVATELKGMVSGPHMEAVLNALSRELSAVAMASLLVAHRCLKKSPVDGREWETRIQRLVTEGLELFGNGAHASSNGQDPTSSQLVGSIDAQLSLCAFVWIRFRLDRLRDFAYLRRLQFNFICRDITPDDHRRAQPLLEAVGPALAGHGATSLLSNCSVASCFRAASDLSARYLNRAAAVVLDGRFDVRLKNDMALLAIYHGHALNLNLERPLKALLRNDNNGTTILRKFFLNLSELPITGYALRFLNVSSRVRDQSDASEVEEILTEAANLISDDSERNKVVSLLRLHNLERRAKHGDTLPSADELLAAWSDQRQSWTFAAVMKILIENGNTTAAHWKLAHSLLEHDPLTDETTAYYFLAMALVEQRDESELSHEQRVALIQYLNRASKKWEKQMRVEINLTAYQLLAKFDSANRSLYDSSLLRWEKIKIERDHLALLPELVQQKKYFLIFNEYYDSARFWGLQTDGSREQWQEFRRADIFARREFVKAWIERGAALPAPLLGPQRSIVSANFLWVGYRLFSPPFYDDDTYEEHRENFNNASKGALCQLSDTILRLPDMPPEVKALLAYHSKQLLSYAGLAVESKGAAA